MNDAPHSLFWKRISRFFLPLLFLFSFLFILFYWHTQRTTLKNIQTREQHVVKLYSQRLDSDLGAIFSDLKFFACQRHLSIFANGMTDTRKELELDYYAFVKEKGLYDQMRFLDETGMERFRVNYNYGSPEIVPDERLQNKSTRYYFKDAFELSEGEIFISPLDLNIEGGKIELPLKPMIRFGMPIFNQDGDKKGVLLFNYLGARMFDAFDRSASQALGSGMLINKDGYWLKGLTEKDEWGFMYPDKKNVTMKTRHPEAWDSISRSDHGQFITDSGLFTFTTVRPLDVNLDSIISVTEAIPTQLSIPARANYYWKIVSFVSPETIAKQSQIPRQASMVSFLIIIALLLTLSVVRTRGKLTEEQAKIAINEKNKRLEEEHVKLLAALKEINENNTELEKAYHDLKAAQSQLLHVEKMQSVGQLAAGVAHEINTPLQFVGDNTRFIQDAIKDIEQLMEARDLLIAEVSKGNTSPELLEKAIAIAKDIDIEFLRTEIPSAIKQSLEGVDRVANIVRAMKDFSHPGIKDKSLVDLNQAIQNTTIISRNEWKDYAELEMELDPELPQVTCMAGEINQVLLNLIINAAHAIEQRQETDKQPGLIRITSHHENNQAILKISDNGTGISEENRTKIFDHFFTTKEVGKGTGQGLAISYSIIVEKHNGTIDLESEVGKATTFIIRLPI